MTAELTPLYTPAEAYLLIGCSRTWLRDHIKEVPHQKIGQKVSFTVEDIQQIREMFRQTPARPTAIAPRPAAPDLDLVPSSHRRRLKRAQEERKSA